MVSFIVVLYRRNDLSTDQFVDYLQRIHAPLAEALPGLIGYLHYLPAPDPIRSRPLWDAVVELRWESVDLMEQAWRSPEGQAATQDLAQFADCKRTSWSLVERSVRR
jgi:uncharacterized protein (TIGR02118 family)